MRKLLQNLLGIKTTTQKIRDLQIKSAEADLDIMWAKFKHGLYNYDFDGLVDEVVRLRRKIDKIRELEP